MAWQYRIADLEDLLQKRDRVLDVIDTEITALAKAHGNPRRTAVRVMGLSLINEPTLLHILNLKYRA